MGAKRARERLVPVNLLAGRLPRVPIIEHECVRIRQGVGLSGVLMLLAGICRPRRKRLCWR